MTLGELALLYNHERGLEARLEVIACQGWSREQTFDQTDLVWINPSPNMRSLTEAMLYPGSRLAGGHEPRHRPRHRHPVRAGGSTLD